MDQKDRSLIMNNISQLANLIKLDEIATLAVVKTIFPQKMMDDILGSHENDAERKQRFLIDLTRRGPKAFGRFVELLKETGHEEAAAILEGRLDNAHFVSPQGETSADNRVIVSSNGNRKVETTLSSHKMRVRDAEQLFKGDDIYRMESKPRGFCILINNVNFENNAFDERKGSNVDAKRLDEVFQELGFDVHYRMNLASDQIKDLLKKVSDREDLKCHDALVVIILSHGQTGCIFGSDNIGVQLETLYSYFNNENCRSLIGKPKMFFIQACRGSNHDRGIDYGAVADAAIDRSVVKIDSTLTSNSQNNNNILNESTRIRRESATKLATWSDFFIAHSTNSGFVSLRNPELGSWFCTELADQLAACAYNTDLQDILHKVDRNVQMKTAGDGWKQSTSTETRGWNKKLYFNPNIYTQE